MDEAGVMQVNPVKKQALIAWVNSICEDCQISRISELQSGEHFISMIKILNECQEFEYPLETPEGCFNNVKSYLQTFYSSEFHIINFHAILDQGTSGNLLEWELSKLLLTLVAALIQEKKSDKFVQSATVLSCEEQMQIMDCLQSIVCKDSPLEEDFAEVLTKAADTGSQTDADIFFKLVSNTLSCERVASTPTLEQSFSFHPHNLGPSGTLRGSPVVNNLSVREINSPLRMLTLGGSPVTPLSVLMQSPQLAHKALIRQKDREIKKLELSIRNETHLRGELELDLNDKVHSLEKKDKKIKELEDLLKEQRKFRDAVDELVLVRGENEKLCADLHRTQSKLAELQDLKEHQQFLERQNEELKAEYTKMKDCVNTLESLKKSHEEYRTLYHKEKLISNQLEAKVSQMQSEIQQAHAEYQQLEESRQMVIQQRDTLRQEKLEMEEMLGAGGVCASVGENMGIVSEKRISELEHELQQLQSNWFEPSIHHSLQKQFHDISIMKETLEVKYLDTQKKHLECEGKLDLVTCQVKGLEEKVSLYESDMKKKDMQLKNNIDNIRTLNSEISNLASSEENMKIVLEELQKEKIDANTEASRLRAELQLLQREAETEKLAHESRRQTLAASIDHVQQERNSLMQQLEREKVTAQQKIDELEVRIGKLTDDLSTTEETNQTKLHNLQSAKKQAEIAFENERWTKDNMIKALKEEMQCLKEEIKETECRLRNEVKTVVYEKERNQMQYEQEKTSLNKKLELLDIELNALKKSGKSKQSELCDEIQILIAEKYGMQSEIDRLKSQCEIGEKNWEQKYAKIECKSNEEVAGLKKEIENLKNNMLKISQDLDFKATELTESQENLMKVKTEMSELSLQFKITYADFESKIKNKDESEALRREEHRSEVSELKEQVSRKSEEVYQKCAIIQELEKANKALQENINELGGNLELLRKVTESKQKDNDTLSCDVSISQKRITELENKMIEQDADYDRLKSEKCGVEKIVSDLRNSIMDITTERDAIKVENCKLTGQVTSLRNTLENTKTEVNQIKESNEEMQEHLLETKAGLQNLSNEKEKDCAKWLCERSELQKELEGLRSHIVCYQNDYQEVVQEKDRLVENMKKLEEEVQSLSCHLEGKGSSLTELELQKSSLEKKIVAVQNALTEKGKKLEEASAEREKMDIIFGDLQSKEQDLEDMLKHKEEEGKGLLDKNMDLQSQLKEITCEVSKLREERTFNDCRFKEMVQNVQEKDMKIENLEEKARNADLEICELRSFCDKLQTDARTAMAESDVEFKLQTEKYNKELAEIKDKAETDKQNLLKKHEDSLKEVIEDFTATNQELRNAKERNENMRENIAKLEECLENEKNQQKRMLEDYEREISDLKKNLSNMVKQSNELIEQNKESNIELENYWRSQLSQLESEYYKASQDQKEEYQQHLNNQQAKFDQQFETLVQEKNMVLANQSLTFQDRLSQMENRLSQKQEEHQLLISKLNKEKTDALNQLKTEHSEKFENIKDLLQSEIESHKELKTEMMHYKDRVSELEKSLKEKKLNFDSTLAEKMESWETEKKILEKKFEERLEMVKKEKETEIETAKVCSRDTEEELRGFKDKMEVTTAESTSLRQQLDAVEEENNRLMDQLIKLKDQQSQVEIVKSEMEREKQEFDIKLLQANNSKERSEIAFKDEILDLQKKLQEMEEKISKHGDESKSKDAECQKLQKLVDSYKVHYNDKKKMIELLKDELDVHRKLGTTTRSKSDKMESEIKSLKKKLEEVTVSRNTFKQKAEKVEKESGPLSEQLAVEEKKNKVLNSQICSLEVQLEYANTQIKEFQRKMENTGTIYLGDGSEFQRMKKASDALDKSLSDSLGGNGRRSTELDDSIFTDSPTIVRKKTTASNVTLKSGMSELRLIDEENKTSDRRLSLRSHSSRRVSSFSSLERSIISSGSTGSTSSVPKGSGNLFHCQEEPDPDMFDWNRVSELQRRNTMCLPHLKTAYPVETQQVKPRTFTDDALRYSLLPSGSGQKRKKVLVSSEDEEDGLGYHTRQSKQVQEFLQKLADKGFTEARHAMTHGVQYHKPGPPTPANAARRHSGKGTTPTKALKTPKTPISKKKSKKTPKKLNADIENAVSTKKSKLSLMFNIGFTPKNKKRKDVLEGSKSTSKGNRQPLRNRNMLRTGLS